MSNITIKNKAVEVKNILANVNVQNRFKEILGKRATGFMTSLINISNSKLKNVEPYSVVNSAMVAATLDLPIDPNLGFAWIVPYNDKHRGKIAQFQMGYKGFVQLALRTGQYKNINVIEIYKGQLKKWDPLTEEIELDFDCKGNDEIIGYAAFFKLLNGFEKYIYWSKEKVTAHGKKFSKTFNNGPWKTDFNIMAEKTVLKNMLSKWGILSIDMQIALKADQATIGKGVLDGEPVDVNLDYIDNPDNVQDAEFEEVRQNEKPKTKLDGIFNGDEEKEDSTEKKEPVEENTEETEKDPYKGTPFEKKEGEE